MKTENTQPDTIAYDEEKIIRMPVGIPGFPGRQQFIIIERKETQPFYFFQCVDDPDLAFVIINPYLFEPDYQVDMASVSREMDWQEEDKDSIKIYAIVNTSNQDPEKITANLMGPLLINTRRKEAVQTVIHGNRYSHKHPIFKADD